MKKTILAILVCGFMVLGLTGCGTDKNEFEVGKKSDVEIVEKGVSLSIKDGTLTNTGVTLLLKNANDVDVQYGEPYEIEIKKDGEWHKINVELNFNLPAYILKTKEIKEIELNWENGYGKLASGDYRIIKSIDIEKEDGTYDMFDVSAEFTIE